MAVEGLVIKTENGGLSELCALSKNEDGSNSEPTSVKMESELTLNDGGNEMNSQETGKIKSLPSSSGETTKTVALERTVKIILKKCDAVKACELRLDQSRTSKMKDGNCTDAAAMRIKKENEFESVELSESESFGIKAGVSVKTEVRHDKQSDVHLSGNVFDEIEKKTNSITYELVLGNSVRNSGSSNIVKREESELQSDFGHYSTIQCVNKDVLNDLYGTCSLNQESTCRTAAGKPLCNRLQEREEKHEITSKLVSLCPGQFKNSEADEKPLLKIVKCEESEASVKSESQPDFECRSVFDAAPTAVNKIVPVIFETEKKVLSKTSVKNYTSTKQYSCPECLFRCQNETDLTKHVKVHSREKTHKCKVCCKKFQSKSNLNRHIILHTNMYKCAHCEAQFKSRESLVSHLKSHSEQRPYSCTECPAKFKASCNLSAHLTTHGSERRFECAHCDYRCKSKNLIRSHMRSHFKDKSYSCTLCWRRFRASGGLKSHLRTKHSSERPFECTQCDARFKSKGSLKVHLSIHSGKKPFQCPHCPSKFRQNCMMKRHLVAIHDNEKLYSCAHCSLRFKQKHEVARHLITHSDENPSCPQCQMTFKRIGDLKLHLRIHTGEKLYTCPQCRENFFHPSRLERHLATHSDERPFACDQCPSKFKTNGGLMKHKNIHVSMRLFSCTQCFRKYKSKDALNRHIKMIHIGMEKRHTCSHCSYRTHNFSHLKLHLLVHDDKQFSCDQCQLKFRTFSSFKRHNAVIHVNVPLTCDTCQMTCKTKESLRRHLKKHVENPYACDKCSFTFPSLSSLKTHSSLHTNERKYRCEHCPARFMQEGNMRRHILTVHIGEKPHACLQCPSRFTAKRNLLLHLKKHSSEKLDK